MFSSNPIASDSEISLVILFSTDGTRSSIYLLPGTAGRVLLATHGNNNPRIESFNGLRVFIDGQTAENIVAYKIR